MFEQEPNAMSSINSQYRNKNIDEPGAMMEVEWV